MQAVCDAQRRFMDIDINHPGATSDYMVFMQSSLRHKLESEGFLVSGLALFGDNAYLNSPYMAAPFKRDSRGSEDAYNFFHSSTRINIYCAFGMLVHRWAILRKPFPCNISKSKTTDLVTCLCKLHNYCIDQNEGRALESTAIDALELSSRGAVPFDQRGNPQQLMRPGHHFDDVNRNERREFQLQLQRNALNENRILPRDYLHKIVIDKALHRTALNDH